MIGLVAGSRQLGPEMVTDLWRRCPVPVDNMRARASSCQYQHGCFQRPSPHVTRALFFFFFK